MLTNPNLVETNEILNTAYEFSSIFGVETNQQFLFVLGIFGFLILYTSNRNMVDDSYNISEHQYSIIEFYSDYWLGCTASKFIVDEFKKENPEVFFVSINASKQKEHPFIDEYKLFNTPTYVLINNKGEKIVRRVGTFNPTYFKKYLA